MITEVKIYNYTHLIYVIVLSGRWSGKFNRNTEFIFRHRISNVIKLTSTEGA